MTRKNWCYDNTFYVHTFRHLHHFIYIKIKLYYKSNTSDIYYLILYI